MYKKIKYTNTRKRTNTSPIQSGDNTHHHDQSILCVSFRTINTIVRSLVNTIPELDEFEFLLILLFSLIIGMNQFFQPRSIK